MYVDWNSSALCDFGLLLALLLAQVPMVANDRLKISHTIQILSLTLDCSYFQCSFHKKFMNTLNIIFCICFCLQLCYWMIPIRFCLKGEKSYMILISCKKILWFSLDHNIARYCVYFWISSSGSNNCSVSSHAFRLLLLSLHLDHKSHARTCIIMQLTCLRFMCTRDDPIYTSLFGFSYDQTK